MLSERLGPRKGTPWPALRGWRPSHAHETEAPFEVGIGRGESGTRRATWACVLRLCGALGTTRTAQGHPMTIVLYAVAGYRTSSNPRLPVLTCYLLTCTRSHSCGQALRDWPHQLYSKLYSKLHSASHVCRASKTNRKQVAVWSLE